MLDDTRWAAIARQQRTTPRRYGGAGHRAGARPRPRRRAGPVRRVECSGTIPDVTARSRRYSFPGRDHRTHVRFSVDEYADPGRCGVAPTRIAAACTSARAERTRIARELHDIVVYSVTTIVLNAGLVQRRITDKHPDEATLLAEAEQTGWQALAELRRLLGPLRTEDHERAGRADGQDPRPPGGPAACTSLPVTIGGRIGGSAPVGQQLVQVRHGQPVRHGLQPRAVEKKVHHGGVGPESDRGPRPVLTGPELLTAYSQIPRGRHDPTELHRHVGRIPVGRRGRAGPAAAEPAEQLPQQIAGEAQPRRPVPQQSTPRSESQRQPLIDRPGLEPVGPGTPCPRTDAADRCCTPCEMRDSRLRSLKVGPHLDVVAQFALQRLMEPLHLPRRRSPGLGVARHDAVLPANPPEHHLGRAGPGESAGELLAVVGEHLVRHTEPVQRLRECPTDRRPVAVRTTVAITQNREWSSTPVTILVADPSASRMPSTMSAATTPSAPPAASAGNPHAASGEEPRRAGRDAPAPDTPWIPTGPARDNRSGPARTQCAAAPSVDG